MNDGRVTVRENEKRRLLVSFTVYFKFMAGKKSWQFTSFRLASPPSVA